MLHTGPLRRTVSSYLIRVWFKIKGSFKTCDNELNFNYYCDMPICSVLPCDCVFLQPCKNLRKPLRWLTLRENEPSVALSELKSLLLLSLYTEKCLLLEHLFEFIYLFKNICNNISNWCLPTLNKAMQNITMSRCIDPAPTPRRHAFIIAFWSHTMALIWCVCACVCVCTPTAVIGHCNETTSPAWIIHAASINRPAACLDLKVPFRSRGGLIINNWTR